MSGKRYSSMYERLVANTKIPEGQNPDTGCWQWTAASKHSKRSPNRYPVMNVRINGKHKQVAPHRVMCEIMLERPLRPDEEPDHICHNTLCINPDHLDPVHHLINKARIRR